MRQFEKRLAALEAWQPRIRGKGHWLVREEGQSTADALAAYGEHRLADGDTVLLWGAPVEARAGR